MSFCCDCGRRVGDKNLSDCVRCHEPCCRRCLDAGFLCRSCSRDERADVKRARREAEHAGDLGLR